MKSLKMKIQEDNSDLARFYHTEYYKAYSMQSDVDERTYSRVGWQIWGVINEALN